jgi:Leu/Phe-tRNA-protein transferase
MPRKRPSWRLTKKQVHKIAGEIIDDPVAFSRFMDNVSFRSSASMNMAGVIESCADFPRKESRWNWNHDDIGRVEEAIEEITHMSMLRRRRRRSRRRKKK